MYLPRPQKDPADLFPANLLVDLPESLCYNSDRWFDLINLEYLHMPAHRWPTPAEAVRATLSQLYGRSVLLREARKFRSLLATHDCQVVTRQPPEDVIAETFEAGALTSGKFESLGHLWGAMFEIFQTQALSEIVPADSPNRGGETGFDMAQNNMRMTGVDLEPPNSGSGASPTNGERIAKALERMATAAEESVFRSHLYDAVKHGSSDADIVRRIRDYLEETRTT